MKFERYYKRKSKKIALLQRAWNDLKGNPTAQAKIQAQIEKEEKKLFKKVRRSVQVYEEFLLQQRELLQS